MNLPKPDYRIVLAGAALAALAVVLGAFGAHGLQSILPPESPSLDTWDTAVLYHMFHALALLVVGCLGLPGSRGLAFTFGMGVVLFSGSLYGLVLGAPKWLGPVTPLGGTLLIVAWLRLCWMCWAQSSKMAADQ